MQQLKSLLFGSSTGCFNDEWRLQGLGFNEIADLSYGIVQHKVSMTDTWNKNREIGIHRTSPNCYLFIDFFFFPLKRLCLLYAFGWPWVNPVLVLYSLIENFTFIMVFFSYQLALRPRKLRQRHYQLRTVVKRPFVCTCFQVGPLQ